MKSADWEVQELLSVLAIAEEDGFWQAIASLETILGIPKTYARVKAALSTIQTNQGVGSDRAAKVLYRINLGKQALQLQTVELCQVELCQFVALNPPSLRILFEKGEEVNRQQTAQRIAELVQIVDHSWNRIACLEAAYELAELGVTTQKAIAELVHHIKRQHEVVDCWKDFVCLKTIAIFDRRAIVALGKIMDNHPISSIRQEAADHLAEYHSQNRQPSTQTLSQSIWSFRSSSSQAVDRLERIVRSNPSMFPSMLELLQNEKNLELYGSVAHATCRLIQHWLDIGRGEWALAQLTHLLEKTDQKETFAEIVICLMQFLDDRAVFVLVRAIAHNPNLTLPQYIGERLRWASSVEPYLSSLTQALRTEPSDAAIEMATHWLKDRMTPEEVRQLATQA